MNIYIHQDMNHIIYNELFNDFKELGNAITYVYTWKKENKFY